MTFWPTSNSGIDFFLCDVRWSTGREKSWEVCSSVNMHCKHTWAPSILHPSSGAPGVLLAPAVATVLMRTAEICFPVAELHTRRHMYSTCSVHTLVVLLSIMSAVCIQTVQVSVHVLSLSVFFVSPVVVFHCLTESQFIYPFSLSTSGSFPIFF